jgi:hypothetical protein
MKVIDHSRRFDSHPMAMIATASGAAAVGAMTIGAAEVIVNDALKPPVAWRT